MAFLGSRDAERSRFYVSLATALDAGLTAEQSLGLITEDPFATPARRLLAEMRRGLPLAEAMARQGAWFRQLEIRAVTAGEGAGRLPDVLRRLAGHFEATGRTRSRIGQALLYPAVLLHAAILLPPLFVLVRGGVAAYLARVVPMLALLYGVAALAVWGWRVLGANEDRQLAAARLVWRMPAWGGIVRDLAVADYAYVLRVLYGSGVPLTAALDQAARASRNALVAAAGRRVAGEVEKGGSLAEALAREAEVFPRVFVAAVRVGETAGKLDEVLERVERASRDEAHLALERRATLLPLLAYVVVAVVVAYVVIGFFASLYGG